MEKQRYLLITAIAAVVFSLCFPAYAAKTAVACQASHEPGRFTFSLQSGGLERRYEVYLPKGGSGPFALVFDLQASGISPEAELAITGMAAEADRRHFIVAAPAAITPFPRGGATWNIPAQPEGPDDVAFIRDVLQQIGQDSCIDESRVFAVGYSGGARLASELACRMPDRFAAIGAVGGLRYPQGAEGTCGEKGPPVPVIAFHSTDDPVNVYAVEGRKAPPWWSYGVETALRRWARRNGCGGNRNDELIPDAVEKRTYTGCRNGGDLVFYRLSGSGHVWPGSSFDFPDYVGKPEPRLPATRLILDFFEAHARGK